ncbi:putative reverse transcriptase domain-containing protein [Tanacetum coccineum]
MSSSSAVTYTSVYTNSEPGRVFWGAEEELSNGGSPRVIVYGYDGLPMQPVAPPSPDYVPGPEHPPSPDYVPGPEHPPSPVEVPYVPDPEYPEYLAPSDGDDVITDDERGAFEDEDDDEKEEEHLALADSSVVPIRIPFAQTRLRRVRKTVRLEPPMSPSMEARIAEYAAHCPHHHYHLYYHLGHLHYLRFLYHHTHPYHHHYISPPVPTSILTIITTTTIQLPHKYEVGGGVRLLALDLLEGHRSGLCVNRHFICRDQTSNRAEGGLIPRCYDTVNRPKGVFDDDIDCTGFITTGTVVSGIGTDSDNLKPREARVSAVLANHETLRNSTNGQGDGSHNSDTEIRGTVCTPRECTYKDFLNCKPLSFKGTEGVVVLSQWFEKMESVFHISNCAVENQVKFGTCTFLGNALTWWNSYMKTVTQDVAYAMDWKALKKMMTVKYCPRGEIKKLEIKLWNLKVKGTDVTSYTLRFQELALMCGRMFHEEADEVEKYVGGLPDMIRGNVISYQPKTMEKTIEFANDQIDQKVLTIAERQAEQKRKLEFNAGNNQGHQQQNKAEH